MRHILASVVLLVLLFPALAMGETVKYQDLVQWEGLHYKKYTNVPLRFIVPRLTEVIFNRPTQVFLVCQFYLDKRDTQNPHTHQKTLE